MALARRRPRREPIAIERKTAIVTGSATGIGAATALALARRGYNLLINYSQSEREAQDTQAACRDAGADTLLLRGNVAEDADCKAMVQAALKRWKRLDALVNNAGISVFGQDAGWDALDGAGLPARSWASTCSAPSRWCGACVPRCRAARGCIVNVLVGGGRAGHRLVDAVHRAPRGP